MNYTKQIFGKEAREELLKGFNIVNDAVSATAGPGGRTVALQNSYGGAPRITKDGISVAQTINIPDYAGEGVKMIVQASEKTANEAGDGTTATVILANEIATQGIQAMTEGCNVTELKKGINDCVASILTNIDKIAKPITSNDEIKQIATISANGDKEIAEYIADAIEKIGKDGVVTVEEARGLKSEIEVVDGMKIDRGYLSPYFITNPEKSICEFDNPYVLLYDGKITSLKPIVSILETIAQNGASLVIMADDVEGEALSTLVINRIRTGLKVCAIKAPEFGDTRIKEMEDLAVLLNGTFISESSGIKLENVRVDALGTCNKIKITNNTTTFINGSGDKEKIKERCEIIKGEIKNTISEYDKKKLKQRLARLSGGVAILKVGGGSELELKERKDRVDDAVCATQAALEQGIVAGGGASLIHIASQNEIVNDNSNSFSKDYFTGWNIVNKSCFAPLKKIADNAGVNGEEVINNVQEHYESMEYGYNALTATYGNLIADGVVDPAKVIKCALQNAASVAGCLLTTEVVLVDDFETNKARTLNVSQQPMMY